MHVDGDAVLLGDEIAGDKVVAFEERSDDMAVHGHQVHRMLDNCLAEKVRCHHRNLLRY
jgi:hypothetical protein